MAIFLNFWELFSHPRPRRRRDPHAARLDHGKTAARQQKGRKEEKEEQFLYAHNITCMGWFGANTDLSRCDKSVFEGLGVRF